MIPHPWTEFTICFGLHFHETQLQADLVLTCQRALQTYLVLPSATYGPNAASTASGITSSLHHRAGNHF